MAGHASTLTAQNDQLNNINSELGNLAPKASPLFSGDVSVGTTSSFRWPDVGSGTGERGIYWHGGSNYGIYRTAGSWSGNFAQLKMKWTTGIILDAGNGQYEKSFVGVNDISLYPH